MSIVLHNEVEALKKRIDAMEKLIEELKSSGCKAKERKRTRQHPDKSS